MHTISTRNALFKTALPCACALALAMSAPAARANTGGASVPIDTTTGSRVETTNAVESAPLNLISRTFARIERGFDDGTDSQRLSYRLSGRPRANAGDPTPSAAGNSASEAQLKALLEHIVGVDDASVISDFRKAGGIEDADMKALDPFLGRVENASGDIDPTASSTASAGLETAIRAALARADITVYTAAVRDGDRMTEAALIVDGETNEVLALLVGESIAAPSPPDRNLP